MSIWGCTRISSISPVRKKTGSFRRSRLGVDLIYLCNPNNHHRGGDEP